VKSSEFPLLQICYKALNLKLRGFLVRLNIIANLVFPAFKLCNNSINVGEKHFPARNLCQFINSNRKPDYKRSKHWPNCANGPVEVSIIEEVEGGDEVSGNV
jgi:hypothetical protein